MNRDLFEEFLREYTEDAEKESPLLYSNTPLAAFQEMKGVLGEKAVLVPFGRRAFNDHWQRRTRLQGGEVQSEPGLFPELLQTPDVHAVIDYRDADAAQAGTGNSLFLTRSTTG